MVSFWNFLRSDEIFKIWSEKLQGNKQARQHTSGHHSDQISRSALRDGATKNRIKHKYRSLTDFTSDDLLRQEGPPLHNACTNGFPEIVKLLLSNGAEFNQPGGDYDLFHKT